MNEPSRLPTLPPPAHVNGCVTTPPFASAAARAPWRPKVPAKPWTWLTCAGVVGLAVLAWGLTARSAAPARPARAEGPLLVAANGVVEGASRERPLAPETAGILKTVHVRVNEEVAVGALLFEVSNDSQQAQVLLAEAELAAAQAQLDHADADLQRARQMANGSAMSRQDFDGHHFRARTARARKQEAEARLQVARAELAKTQVRAPVAGQVLQIYKEAGAPVGPAGASRADVVLRLADLSRRRVRAFVEELDVGRVQLGQSAAVTADGFPGRVYAGRVVEIAGRMGKDVPESDAPGEYKDVFFREVLIELEAGRELPLNLRVQVRITPSSPN